MGTTIRTPTTAVLTLLAALLALAACGETRPSTFYTLTPETSEVPPDRGPSTGLNIGVGPTTLPQYINRPQMVTRASPNRLQISEFNRWAEPIEDAVKRSVAEYISTSLGTDNVFILPRRQTPRLDYRVTIDILQFDAGADGRTTLAARWMIFKAREDEPRVTRRSVIRGQASDGGDYEAIALALSTSLRTLADEIAAGIEETY